MPGVGCNGAQPESEARPGPVLRARRTALLASMGIFLVALITRVASITVPINIDEGGWIHRAPAFYVALLSGKPAETYVRHHPGVTNMWLTGAGLSLQYLLRNVLPPNEMAQSSADLAGYLAAIATEPLTPLSAYAAGRWVSAFVTSASLLGLYLLSRRLFGDAVALAAAAILLFEPFFVAYQRSLTTDANQTNFTWLAFLSFLLYASAVKEGLRDGVGRQARGWLLVSGVFFGLAAISKITAALTLPAFGLVALWTVWRERPARTRSAPVPATQVQAGTRGRAWARILLDMLLWGATALLTCIIVWPALWADLRGTLNQLTHGLGSEVAGNDQFFLGEYTRSPGILYYPVVLLARLSPLLFLGSLLGLTALIVPALRVFFSYRDRMTAIILLTGIMLVSISTFASKQDRYIVPMMPGLALLTAGGIWACVRAWQAARARAGRAVLPGARTLPLLMGGIVVVQSLVLIPHLPYYLSYFSPFVGGPRGAERLIMVGNGELLDQAAKWVEQNVPLGARVSIRDYGASMMPYLQGRRNDLDLNLPFYRWNLTDLEYVVVYSNQLQRHFPPDLVNYFSVQRPLDVVRWRGADYAKIYAGTVVRPEALEGLPHPVNLDFGGYARLIGYDLETAVVEAGDPAVLILYWETTAPFPSDDFQVSVGLRDAEGNVYGRADTVPVGGQVPVDLWQPGQVIRDAQQLPIPPGTPPASYTLEVGLFSPKLGQALEIRDADGPRGNRVPVAQLEVARSSERRSVRGEVLGVEHVLDVPLPLVQNGPRLLGYDCTAPPQVDAGAGVPITTLWQAGDTFAPGTELFLKLSTPEGRWRRIRGHPVGGAYPPDRWSAGELVRDVWTALLPAGVPEGRYQLELVAVVGDVETPLVNLGTVAVRSRPRDLSGPTPAFPEVAVLGEFAQLIGYDMPGTVSCGGARCLASGAPFALVLRWKVLGEAERNYARFVHLLDENGGIVAQRDEPPGGAGLPTTGWMAGEYIADPASLETGKLPRGRYRIAVGLYDPATGRRLSVPDPDGQDRIILSQSVEIR